MNKIYLNQTISECLAGARLDFALAKLFPEYSRSQIQQWIEKRMVALDQKVMTKNNTRVFPGQVVQVEATLERQDDWQPEFIPLDIIYEDAQLVVINKPQGLVVHPGAGNSHSTLVNALIHWDPELAQLPRAGLIHRLDKDTSGLLLVARTLESHHFLVQQMQDRQIARTYQAIIYGTCKPTGEINLPIGRHPSHRTKMAVLSSGKTAITHYKLLKQFKNHSYLEIKLETGRTHQIRVHMAHQGNPIVGDALYGRQIKTNYANKELCDLLETFPRQALHAINLTFLHPTEKEFISLNSPLPNDIQQLLNALFLTL